MNMKRFLVIMLSVMMVVTTTSPTMALASSYETPEGSMTSEDVEETIVEDEVANNVLMYTNADTKEVKKGQSPVYEITVTGENDFPEGVGVYLSEIMKKDEISYYTDGLNDYLRGDRLSADVVLPFIISLYDNNGEELDPGQTVHVSVKSSDQLKLDQAVLYHLKKDNTWEKVPYVAGKDFVEFDTDSFSPFIFVKENEMKEEAEQAKNEGELKDEETPKAEPEKTDEAKTEDTTKEKGETIKKSDANEKADEDVDSLTGSRSTKKSVDSVVLYNDAAESKKDAVATLTDELSFSQKKANAIASDMFSKKGNRGEDEEDVPRQGDGSNIEYISAKWITGDSVTNDDDSLLYYKPESDNPFDVRLQFNYALSGEHNYEPGDIVITIPENIIKTRSGKYAGHVILPYPEEPSTKSDFNWKLVNGNYVLTNTKRMSAATKGYIQVGFDELIPHELVDMEVSEDFDAYIEVTTHKGNTIALRSNKLSAQFDTEARIVNDSLRKKQYGQIERVPASEIPASQRIEGEEEYIVVQWYIWGAVTANTYYTMDIVDHIPQDAQVTSDLKESDVHGFILKATSEDGTVLEDRNVYRGYGSGQTRYYYYKTAYPASQFEPNVQYTFHNDAEMIITEVDPPAEVTNANVQEEDPQLVTDAQAAANPNWSYTLPEWHNPTGHFMVCKNGNDDKVGRNMTHHSQYSGGSYSDEHIWKHRQYIDLWYGIYPSAMNDLDDGKDVNLSYTIDSVGYTMPWMFDAGSYSTDGEMAARKSVNYSKPVTMITEDTGVRIGNSQQKLKVFDDYEFVSIEFPIRPYVYTGTPKNINPDGSWTALTAGDGTFEYVLDKDYSHYPDIVLELYSNGKWEEYATVSWTTGEPKITLKDGTEVSGAIVDVPSDTENFRTKVTVQNTLGANPGNLISQAAIDYDVRPLIKLINTNNIKQIVEDGFAASHSPSMTVRNSVNMKAYGEESADPIVSIDKEGHDVLRGYTTDIEVYPSKSSKQTIKDADYVNRRVKIHYSAKVEERSVINDNKTYMQAIEDGRLAAETHGVWYDLLPKGVTPDVSTVTLRSGDKVINARTVENYKKSGRTLLVVEAELTPVPERYRSGDMYYYEDVPRISFDAWYDFDAMTDYGKAIHNVIAFESSNDKIGTTDGYSGEYDDPNTGDDQNVSTHLAFKTDEEKEWMTDLDPDRDTPSFVYAGTTTSIDIISAARLSLQKDVMVNNDGIWGSGVFNSDRVSEDGTETFQYNEQSKKDNEMVVWEGGLYSYKLRMMPDDETRARDMVIYDSIETFKAGNGNEPIDEMAAKANATWQGDFMSVDVSQLEEKGCAPVVYYSTIENLPLSDENDPTIGKKANMLFKDDGTINTSVWIKAEDYQGNPADVTAVAVDASKKADGSDFTLEPLESVVILINMRAPSGQAARDIVANAGAWGTSAYAYNNAYLTGTTIDINTLDEDGDNFVRKDYTKVGLVEYKYDVKKVWDDGDNRDGKRPENIVVNLYANGVATGDSIVLNESNKWEGSFEHIPYTTPDGTKIRYSAVENEVDDYTTDINAAETTTKITNKYEPERISLDVAKNWVNDTEENRPEYITVELYGNGKKITSKRMDKTTEWKCLFTDLYKNENGLPIRYTAKEIFPNGDVKHLSYVANDPDGIVLTGVLDPVTGPDFDDPLGLDEDEFDGEFTNTYHPHGDLYVTKDVTDVTDVSKEQEFSFTFNFNKTVEGEVVPVLTEYDYDVLDENEEVVSSGKVTDNSVVKIKGGQKIHVKEIDEYVSYKVSESEEAGFNQVNAQNTEGIIRPNSSVQALFENKYAANGQLNLDVDKTLMNRALKKYQFKFELYEVTEEDGTEKETLIRTATSGKPDDPVLREDGTIDSSHAVASFGVIRYTQADAGKTFTYKVKEVKADKPGYVYDTNEYVVRVAVTDNGDGTLNVASTYYKEVVEENNIIENIVGADPDVTYEQVDDIGFTNKYEANGEIVLRAWKDLQGRRLTDGEFEFELLDENGQPIYKVNPETGELTDEPITAMNTEDGSVVFDAIKFDEKDIGKTFNYAIREKVGTDDTVNYDENVYGYSITVYDNGDGTLSFSQVPATPVVEGNYPAENDVELTEGYGMGFPMKIEDDDKIVFDTSAPAFNSGLSRIVLRLLEIGDVTTTSVEYEGRTYSIPKSVVFEGKDQEIADIFDANGNSFPTGENVRVYVEFDSLYDSLEGSYLMGWITGEEEIVGWNTDEAELPVFTNTLKDGSLSVTKHVTNAENADPDQKFKFKVKLIGNDIEDKEFDYRLEQVSPLTNKFEPAEPSVHEQRNVDQNKKNATPEVDNIKDVEKERNESSVDRSIEDSNVSALDRIMDKIIPKAYAADEDKPFHATSSMLVGKSYAVLTAEGELIFFRSNSTYEHQSTGTFVDIKGNTYEGTVYCGDHPTSGGGNDGFESSTSSSNIPFPYSMRRQVLSVRVAEGQAIRPWRNLFGTTYSGSMRSMFYGFENCTSIDLKGFDTTHCDSWKNCFYGCKSLTEIDLSYLDMSDATSVASMFSDCKNLTFIDLSDKIFSKVQYASYMFYGCHRLTAIAFSNSGLNFSNAKELNSMFDGCRALQELDLSSFRTGNATKMNKMFANCTHLTNLDISSFDTSSVTTMSGMFHTCNALTSLDLSHFDTRNVTDMSSMFQGCCNLTTIDVSSFRGPKLTNISSMFNGCSSLTVLDLSNFETTYSLTNAEHMFGTYSSSIYDPETGTNQTVFYSSGIKHVDISGMTLTGLRSGSYSLWDTYKSAVTESVVLGTRTLPMTRYLVLPTPPESKDGISYTGKWIREDEAYGPYTPTEMISEFTPAMAGKWVWEKVPTEYRLNFATEEGASGVMPSVKAVAAEDYQIPKNQFAKFGYEFDYWDDGQGNTYQNGDIIPADTYEIGDAITLTAIFRERNTTVAMENGEFEFELYGDEKAIFDNIPAGTAYQVYEETPDGWVLIEQSNTSGEIEPLETSEASFTNKYEPGTATAQFFGTKTLDGHAAEADSYSFILDETTEGASGTVKMLVNGEEQDVELPYTVTVSEGGFIQFPAIKYSIDDIGIHTYTIKEVNPNDDHIDYDTHVETIKVNVTGDVTELKAETVIDEDGDGKISFANKTRPGILKIKKTANMITSGNQDDMFTFKVTLQNDKGMPFDDTIYWYREKNGVPVIDFQNTNRAKKQSAVDVDNAVNINANDVSIGETTKSASNSKFAVFGATSGGSNNTKATVIASGTAPGGCPWRVTSDRKLIYGKEGYTYNLGPGWIREGVAGYTSSGVGNGTWPTFDYINGGKYDDNGQVSDILFEGEVHLRGPLIDIIYSPCSWLNDNKGQQRWGRANTLDLSNANVTGSTSYNGIFASANTLRTISNYDPSMFTGENVVDFGYMFASSAYDKHGLDATKLDTSSGKYFDDMFNNAGARELSLSNMYTGEGINFMYTFTDPALEKLDIRNFDTRNASIMRGMFYVPRDSNNTKLSSITLGPNFRFKGNNIESVNDQAILPTPPEEFTTGKWVRADDPDMVFTPEELRDAYDADPENMAGTWIWEVDTSKGIVRFDANGGYTSANQIKATSADQAITMPGNKTTRFGYILTGWNTEVDGSGREIGPNETVDDIVNLGSYVTLYAQWAENPLRDYKVEHYQQKSDLSGYTLVKTDTLEADKNTDVTPEPLHYDGFVSPEPQTATVAEDGSTVISYYYDRVIYNITFDGNGATAGQMKDVSRVSNVSAALPKNTYQKAGYMFLGWSTDPDATVAEYNDGSSMRKLINDGESLTLYAVWMSNEDSAIVPQNGELYVKCKPGETIVIPNLPAGTTYTVEEVDMPGGWTYSGTTGNTGNPIIPNVANTVTVRNNYSLQGSATIVAHKTLEKSDVEEGQFTFELLDSSQRVLQTVTNGPVDNTDVLLDEDGNEIGENPWKGSAPVEFSPIHYTNTGTYTYYIREKRGNEDNIVYDDHMEEVTVVLTDAGRGFLSADIRYDDDGALFENTLTPGKLKVHKTVVGEDESDESFDFSIRLKDKDGHLIDGPIDATKVWKNPVVVQPEGHVTKYSHTSNINDNGVKQSDFESSRYYSDIISVPGADHLDLSIDYTNPRGFLYIWDDAHSEARYMTGSSSNWTSDFNPDTAQEYIAWTSSADDNIILHRDVRVEGDSATIVFYSYAYTSNSCPPNNGGYNENTNYGYYAVVDAYFDEKILSGEPVSLENGGTFSLKDGESLEISDLEEGLTYEVTELSKDGWLLVSSEGAEGEIVKGATSEASFVNTPGTPPPYEANGQALLKAKKTMTGGTIKAEDGFVFELLDNNGNVLQTKNVDQLGGSSSDITFDPIAYTEKDAGVPVEYDVQVMLMKNGETVPTIITLDQNDYTESGDSISGSFTWDDAAYADYNRKQVVVSAVPKDPELSEYTKQEIVDMSDKSSVEFSFDSLTKSVGGEYRYTIREQKGNSDNVAYDTTNYEAVVTVLDNGDGSLNTQVEYFKGDEAVSEAEFVNERLFDIHIVKKDKDTLEIIAGAKFTIKSGDQYLHSNGTLSDTPEEFETDSRGRIDVTNVPAGTYTLHETQAPGGYTAADDIVFTVNEDGTVVNGESVDEVVVLEELDTHDITLGKSVSGNMGDTSDRFIFTVHFTGDIVPDQLVSTFCYADGRVSTSHITVGESQTLRVALHHNESITWSGVPHGAEYTVTEEAADQSGYVTSATAQIGTVGADKVVRGTLTDNESVTYTNTRESVTPTGTSHIDIILFLLLIISAFAFIIIRKRQKKIADI